MTYTITHSCGHEEEHELCGKSKIREWRAGKLSQEICTDCAAKAKAKRMAEASAEWGLPDLQGTEKQVAWANEIRMSVAEEMAGDTHYRRQVLKNGRITEREFDEAFDYLGELLYAGWWIARRSDLRFRPAETLLEARQAAALTTHTDSTLVVEPTTRVHNTVVTVYSGPNTVLVKSEYNEDLRLLVKSHGYKWDGANRVWKCSAGTAFRTEDDAVAEAANLLLATGFPVKIEARLRDMTVDATFKPFPTRFVLPSGDGGLFLGVAGADHDAWSLFKSEGVPDHTDDVLSTKDIPSWKRMCMCILKNDYTCRTMGFGLTKDEQKRVNAIKAKYASIIKGGK